ncbi:MAG: hypothetical protein ACPGQL_01940 [Thermoplasmatota archaeon]
MHAALRGLLAELFRLHGYDVRQEAALQGSSGALYTVPVLARDGERAILVEAGEPSLPVPDELAADLDGIREDVGAAATVLLHWGPAPHAPPGVVLWDAKLAESLMGATMLATATAATLQPLPVTPRSPEAAPLAQARSAVDAEAPARFDLKRFEALDLADVPAPVPAAAATPAPAVVPREPAAPNVPTFAVKIHPDEAKQNVAHVLFGADEVRLHLQPVWVFDFACDLFIEGSLRSETIEGRVQVHGTDRTVSLLDPESVAVGPLPSGIAVAEPRTVRVRKERAYDEARQSVLDAHTREVPVEVTDPELDFTYVEKRRVEPRPDHLRLTDRGLHHRPIWRLSGLNGWADVDAVSGELVAEGLRSRSTDAVVLD